MKTYSEISEVLSLLSRLGNLFRTVRCPWIFNNFWAVLGGLISAQLMRGGHVCCKTAVLLCTPPLLSSIIKALRGRHQIVLHFYANRALTILQSNPMRQTDIWYIMVKLNIGNVRTRKSSNFAKCLTFLSNSCIKCNKRWIFWRFMTRFNVRGAISSLSFTDLAKQDLALPSIKPYLNNSLNFFAALDTL